MQLVNCWKIYHLLGVFLQQDILYVGSDEDENEEMKNDDDNDDDENSNNRK